MCEIDVNITYYRTDCENYEACMRNSIYGAFASIGNRELVLNNISCENCNAFKKK
jgi:MinD superfamily P-loop ATPase